MKVIDHVKEFLNKHNINDIILSEGCKESAAATYDFGTKELAINTQIMVKEAERLKLSISEIVCLIISHELGHYLDPDLEKLHYKKIKVMDKIDYEFFTCNLQNLLNEGISYVIQAEKNAWNLGGKFVPIELKNVYFHEMTENLHQVEIEERNKIGRFMEAVLKREKSKRGK